MRCRAKGKVRFYTKLLSIHSREATKASLMVKRFEKEPWSLSDFIDLLSFPFTLAIFMSCLLMAVPMRKKALAQRDFSKAQRLKDLIKRLRF